ncbi:hypothetical protein J2S22_002080 [Rhodoplanes tepidamans]|uniref:Uncharacterized protein n=1 Tax=Rhodoplanes tepidamans TaxID=200616 RepID=A0ABT5JEY7_RHOTP|nr:hypothetical protein [Rhodoplanes tepidamans]MDC7788159.1 hypothetical protein [Rhodoplanes tepidamans]MDQ0355151.1 hypothetical protein [Rhodoplanes tepidamans]
MIVLDWILLASVGGFVAAALAASTIERNRTGTAGGRRPLSGRAPAPHGLWSVAEAAWIGARRPLGRRTGADGDGGPAGYGMAGAYDVRVRWSTERDRAGPA